MAVAVDLPQVACPLKAVQVVLLAGSWMTVMVVVTNMVESSRQRGCFAHWGKGWDAS
jgi:hypothetical protein